MCNNFYLVFSFEILFYALPEYCFFNFLYYFF